MPKKNNITANFSADLLRWYAKHKRDLPWRHTKDPYRIWISEVMLQQTTVNAVIPFYQRWFEIFPTTHALAQAPLQSVLKQWQGLGYYNRAKNLHKAVQVIVEKHRGQLPNDPLIVRKLPGFGPYTTGSVLSIAYDRPLTIIDANVRRVIMRLLVLPGFADTKQDNIINKFLLQVLPNSKNGDFNQALMELGALICRNKEPLCVLCPVSGHCRAYAQGKQEIIPEPKKKTIKSIQAVVGIIRHRGKYFIQKRPSTGLLADLWEFPGGKIEAGESALQALKRELKEEIDVDISKAVHLFEVTHFYTQFRVKLFVYHCQCRNLPAVDETHQWVSFKALHQYPMPSGSAKIIEKLK